MTNGSIYRLTDQPRSLFNAHLPPVQSFNSDTRLGLAALQLEAAQFGYQLYARICAGDWDLFDALGTRVEIVELNAGNSTFRGIATALDLCAACLYWMNNSQPLSGDQEMDVGRWGEKRHKQLLDSLPAHQKKWVQDLQTDSDWELLTSVRDHYTHRWFPRHQTISLQAIGSSGPRPLPVPTQIEIDGVRYNLIELGEQMLEFGSSQFEAFCSVVQATYP